MKKTISWNEGLKRLLTTPERVQQYLETASDEGPEALEAAIRDLAQVGLISVDEKSLAVKQVIVMRNDLNMRKGKMIAQGAHASLAAVLSDDFGRCEAWLEAGMKKICVRVDSEAELLAVVEQAKAAGLLVAPIRDAGHTEFHGVPTWTCCAIGPGPEEEIDKITGGLKLL